MVIRADLNGHVGKGNKGDEEVIRKYTWHQRTKLGRTENNRFCKKDEISCHKHVFSKDRRAASNL